MSKLGSYSITRRRRSYL